MIRTHLTNQRIDPREAKEFYRNAFWEMRDLISTARDERARSYRELRMATRQYERIRTKVQSLTTFEALQGWLNEDQFEVFACPFNVMDDRRKVVGYQRARIHEVIPLNVDNTFRHDEFSEEPIKGRGWSVEIWFTMNPGRFDLTALKQGLAAFGIYTIDSDYSDDENGKRAYKLTTYMLRRDFKMTDAKASQWKERPEFGIDDDEDDIPESLAKARMIEDGLMDEEVDFYGYR